MRTNLNALLAACRTFARASDGSSGIEYAAILSMVVGLSYLAYAEFSSSSDRSFDRVAQSLHGDKQSGKPTSSSSGRGASADLDYAGDADERTAASPEAIEWMNPFWLRVSALGVTILAAGALMGNRHIRSRRAADAADAPENGVPRNVQAAYAEKRQLILKMLSGHNRRQTGECITVRHLMTTTLKTISATMPVGELRQLMHDVHIRHLLVVRGEDQLVGIVSDRDVSQREGRTAADIMTRNPVSVGPETPAIQAISAMLNGRFSCLPVAEEGQLVGLLTTSDLMMALQCTLQLMTQSAEAGFSDAPAEVKGARYFARLLEQQGEDEESPEPVDAGR